MGMILLERVSEGLMLRAVEESSGRKPKNYAARQCLWKGLPDCKWYRISLTDYDLGQVSLIRNELNWLALGGYFREPTAAATWVMAHPKLTDEFRNYAYRMDNGEFPAFPVVLVGPPNPRPSDLVVLDGNHRVVAACMAATEINGRLPMIVGLHKHIDRWAYYRDGKRIKKTLNEVGW